MAAGEPIPFVFANDVDAAVAFVATPCKMLEARSLSLTGGAEGAV